VPDRNTSWGPTEGRARCECWVLFLHLKDSEQAARFKMTWVHIEICIVQWPMPLVVFIKSTDLFKCWEHVGNMDTWTMLFIRRQSLTNFWLILAPVLDMVPHSDLFWQSCLCLVMFGIINFIKKARAFLSLTLTTSHMCPLSHEGVVLQDIADASLCSATLSHEGGVPWLLRSLFQLLQPTWV